MRRLQLVAMLLVPLLIAGASADVTPSTQPSDSDAAAKQADIRKLLDLTGSGKLGVQVASQMMVQFRQTMPNVPNEFWDGVMQELNPDELVELVVPIYERHFSHEDIKDIIRFYESPVGKKMTGMLPQIMQESMAAGQQWGQELARKVQERLKEKGYVKS